jgi:protein-tyrosine-phosphatase
VATDDATELITLTPQESLMKWITRERARVDRIACPWLISRFIDARPEFLFVPASQVLERAKLDHAIPYDIPNVELGHHGPKCSFDAFIDRYELADPALARLAPMVRGADTDDRGLTPESAGLYAAATGFQATSRDDFDNMARQFPMYDALYAYCRAQPPPTPPRPRVLFVCQHGAAKSVVAAAHFRRVAAGRGLAVDSVAAGTEPDPELAPAAVKGLAGDGVPATPARPRPVTLYDLDSAARVVSFGCEITAPRGQRVDQWDVPAVGDGYAAARDRIVSHVERLVAELAAGG